MMIVYSGHIATTLSGRFQVSVTKILQKFESRGFIFTVLMIGVFGRKRWLIVIVSVK
jgi:hypothetical protein